MRRRQGYGKLAGYAPIAAVWLLSVAAALAFGACGSAFGEFDPQMPGNAKFTQPQLEFWVTGTPGTPFRATVSDAWGSWDVRGTVPLEVAIANSSNPGQIVATKLSNDNATLSVQVAPALIISQVSSTSQPYGTVGAASGVISELPPPASPDVRFYVNAPSLQIFDALLETANPTAGGYVVEARVPALLLYSKPGTKTVAATVDEQNVGIYVLLFGPLQVDAYADGALYQEKTGAPSIAVCSGPGLC